MARKRAKFKPDERGALKALKAVADALGLPPRTAPSAKQFREIAPRVAPGWSVHYVGVAYGRWRLATEAFEEGRPPGRRLHYGRLPRSDDPADKALAALRLWLDSSPKRLSIPSYERFAHDVNATMGPDDEPLPMGTAIYNALKLNFDEAVRVARGDVELRNAKPYERKHPPNVYEDREGPFGLIGPRVVAEICGVTYAHLETLLSGRHGFPTPSLVIGDIHLRRRSDVDAYVRGEDVPPRQFNELSGEYATVSEIAAELGVAVTSVRRAKWLPEPEVVASGRRAYRRSEIRDTLEERRSRRA